jgi:hypothetical protein
LPLEDLEPVRAQMARLTTLGFQRIGVKWEQVGKTRSQAVNFASPEHQCFADWFVGGAGSPVFYAFTVFEDGALVLTANGGGWAELDRPTAIRAVVHEASVDATLARHAQSVRAMQGRGHRLPTRFDQAARLEATHAYYRNGDIGFGRQLVQLRLFLLDSAVTLILGVCLIVGVIASQSPRVGNIVGAVACTSIVAQWLVTVVLASHTKGTVIPWKHSLFNSALAAATVWQTMH